MYTGRIIATMHMQRTCNRDALHDSSGAGMASCVHVLLITKEVTVRVSRLSHH